MVTESEKDEMIRYMKGQLETMESERCVYWIPIIEKIIKIIEEYR